jgi:hypothetical protein
MKIWIAVGLALCGIVVPVLAQEKSQGKQTYAVPRLADGKPDLNGIWQVQGNVDADIEGKINGKNIIVDPSNGKIPYKPEAVAQQKANMQKKATDDPLKKCWLPGVPRLMYIAYPYQIVESANQPVIPILSEYAHVIRNIHMRGQHLEGLENWLGDSRGKWEGDTLVVDVTNFNDQTWFDAAGNYHSNELNVTERYTRTGPNTIAYEATMTDPKVLARPFKIAVTLNRNTAKNAQIMEHECYADKEGPTFTVGDKK